MAASIPLDSMKITEEEYVLELPPHLKKKLPLETIIIDEINDEFNSFIQHINKQNTIGVYLEGSNIGRHGNLSLLSISTSICVFLFDIEILKNEAFSMGLKEILEDSNIQKIFYDCRKASDCLYHQYNTTLINVFDIQIADYFVTLQNSNCEELLENFNPLHKCLMYYLKLDPKYVHIENEENNAMNDPSIHFRPITNECRDAAVKHCIYLCMLKEILFSSLMGPYNYAVQEYLRVLSNASDGEAAILREESNLGSSDFFLHDLEVFCFKRKKYESDELDESLEDSYLEINVNQLHKSSLQNLQNQSNKTCPIKQKSQQKEIIAEASLKTHDAFEESLANNYEPNVSLQDTYLKTFDKKPQESNLQNQQKQTEQEANADTSLGSCDTPELVSVNNEKYKPRKSLLDIVLEKIKKSPRETNLQNQAKEEVCADILKEVSTTNSELRNQTGDLIENDSACFQKSSNILNSSYSHSDYANIRPLPPIQWDLIHNGQESPKNQNITLIPAGMALNIKSNRHKSTK